MTIKLKLLTASVCAAILSGCSSIPQGSDRISLDGVKEKATSGWEDTPAVVYRNSRQAAELLEPNPLPDHLYEKSVDLKIFGKVAVRELIQVIELSGVPVMMANADVGDTEILMPRYNNSIGSLLNALSAGTALSFNWYKGVLIVDKESPYLLKVPQNEDIAKAISSAIEKMGAADVQVSKEAGIVSYKADSKEQMVIKTYLDRLAVNTSMINLQLAVINVNLDEQRRQGLDWSTLSVKAGELGLLGVAANAAEDVATGAAMSLTGSGVSMVLNSGNVSLSGVLNMLSTYGESNTVQNLTLKTLSGIPVDLKSGESIPYVENISLSVSDSGTSSSGTDTSTVETGFNVSINPYFDAEDGVMTVDMDLSMKSLVGFRELSAGNQIGSLTRPQIQNQELGNTALVEAGETILVGGLVYQSSSDNRTSLTGLENMKAGSKATKLSKNAMFILLRPTAVVYGPQKVEKEAK